MPALSLDAREGVVSGPGGEIRLEPKVMDVLELLARYSGHVVSRDELMNTVWRGRVVTDHTLSRCIYQLRDQLRKASGREDIDPIETLPKRGYRLLLLVERAPADIRYSGSSLFIEIKRRYLLIGGLILFLVVLAHILYLGLR